MRTFSQANLYKLTLLRDHRIFCGLAIISTQSKQIKRTQYCTEYKRNAFQVTNVPSNDRPSGMLTSQWPAHAGHRKK